MKWISATLRTAKSTNLRQITILICTFFMSAMLREPASELTREWQDLDHLLVQLWTTRSIRLVFTYVTREKTGPRVLVSNLLPELVKRGLIDVV